MLKIVDLYRTSDFLTHFNNPLYTKFFESILLVFLFPDNAMFCVTIVLMVLLPLGTVYS